MKKMICCLLIIFSFCGVSEAVLPPLYSTLKEYQALLYNKELVQKLESGEAILSIERQNDVFIIMTPKSILKVDVIYEPREIPGPAKFHLIFHDPIPRD